jgi:hypothetical protein
MEEFQRVGDELSRAIMEGNVEEAMRLVQKAVTLDAEFEVFLEPRGKERAREEGKEKGEERERVKNKEIYERLIDMGVEKARAVELANKTTSIEDAINQL